MFGPRMAGELPLGTPLDGMDPSLMGMELRQAVPPPMPCPYGQQNMRAAAMGMGPFGPAFHPRMTPPMGPMPLPRPPMPMHMNARSWFEPSQLRQAESSDAKSAEVAIEGKNRQTEVSTKCEIHILYLT